MLDEHSVLTVNRDEILWLDKAKYHLMLFLRCMPGNMKIGMPVVYNFCALVEKLIYDAADHILIAGYGRSRNNYPVA